MEPLPEGSGRKSTVRVVDESGTKLQWSRFPKEAEGDFDTSANALIALLQWSRFPKEAEGAWDDGFKAARHKLQWSRFPKEAEGPLA